VALKGSKKFYYVKNEWSHFEFSTFEAAGNGASICPCLLDMF
jgi:hypothetical protein